MLVNTVVSLVAGFCRFALKGGANQGLTCWNYILCSCLILNPTVIKYLRMERKSGSKRTASRTEISKKKKAPVTKRKLEKRCMRNVEIHCANCQDCDFSPFLKETDYVNGCCGRDPCMSTSPEFTECMQIADPGKENVQNRFVIFQRAARVFRTATDGKRVALPICCYLHIRRSYQDKLDNYTGFQQ